MAYAGLGGTLSHRGPGSVPIATSVAAGDLRLTVDIDGVGVRSALQPIGLIGWTGNHRSIATGIRILPRQRACPYSLSVLGRSRECPRRPRSKARRARQRSGERTTCLKPPDDLTP